MIFPGINFLWFFCEIMWFWPSKYFPESKGYDFWVPGYKFTRNHKKSHEITIRNEQSIATRFFPRENSHRTQYISHYFLNKTGHKCKFITFAQYGTSTVHVPHVCNTTRMIVYRYRYSTFVHMYRCTTCTINRTCHGIHVPYTCMSLLQVSILPVHVLWQYCAYCTYIHTCEYSCTVDYRYR